MLVFSRSIMVSKNVAIRTDSSTKMGTGHVMRCLTLADQLRDRGARIFFICRDIPGNLIKFIYERQYPVHTIYTNDWRDDAMQTERVLANEGRINLLVVDHYELSCKWEQQLRPYTDKIMVIDDLANRVHECNVLLDQNLYPNMDTRYRGLVPEYCQQFLGPQYMLLRNEFFEARKKLRKRDGRIGRILVFFGGSDPTNETEKVLNAIKEFKLTSVDIDVVVGRSNVLRDKIQELCSTMPGVNLHCQINYMAELMATADLGIGAGGITTWERCYLGLPSIIIAVADNQEKSSEYMHWLEAGIYLGSSCNVRTEKIIESLSFLFCNPFRLKEMGRTCLALMSDIRGVSEWLFNFI